MILRRSSGVPKLYRAVKLFNGERERNPRGVSLCGFRYYAEWDLHTAATGAQGPARQAAMQAGMETGPPSTATTTKSRAETKLLLAILILFLKYCIKLIFGKCCILFYS
jgi:hypothetical protein